MIQPAPPSPTKRLLPAFGLFLAAPLIAEFLLGNLPITWLGLLVVLAPLYGGGALLIRETARRFNLRWPAIIVLGLAFGIVEEAFVTGSLFNANYLGLRLLDYGYLPPLGVGAWWTVFVLTLHMIWSTAVPIALVESLTPAQRRTPWLGSFGLGLTALIFVLGCVAIAATERKKGFIPSAPQLVCSGLLVATLVALAFGIGRNRQNTAAPSRRAPAPLITGAASLVVGSVFFFITAARDRITASANVVATLLVLAVASALFLSWSRRRGWCERHRLALAAGFLLTYAWHGFVQVPSVGNVSPRIDLLGDIVWATTTIAVLGLAKSRVWREPIFGASL